MALNLFAQISHQIWVGVLPHPGGKDAVALPVGQKCSLYIINFTCVSPRLGTIAGLKRYVLYGAEVAHLWVPMPQSACMALIQALCWVCYPGRTVVPSVPLPFQSGSWWPAS